MKTKLLSIVSLFLIFLISACEKDDELINVPINLGDDYYNNTPVIVNTGDNFTFTISANKFTYQTENELNFTNSDSIVVTITLTNCTSNNSIFTLYGTDESIILSEPLNTNKVIVRNDLKNVNPTKCIVNLSDFTGKMTIVVANQK